MHEAEVQHHPLLVQAVEDGRPSSILVSCQRRFYAQQNSVEATGEPALY